MSYNTHSDNAHPDLAALRARLRHIQESIENFQPLTTKPSILDSSVDVRDEEEPWLQPETVPGLKVLRHAVKRDLDVLEGVSFCPHRPVHQIADYDNEFFQ
jgi:hypothetical protein